MEYGQCLTNLDYNLMSKCLSLIKMEKRLRWLLIHLAKFIQMRQKLLSCRCKRLQEKYIWIYSLVKENKEVLQQHLPFKAHEILLLKVNHHLLTFSRTFIKINLFYHFLNASICFMS